MWHKKDREKGEVPHTSIDTPGALGQVRLARVGVRVEAPPRHHRGRRVDTALSPAHPLQNVADSRIALRLIEELPEEARFVLGDTHYNAPEVRAACVQTERFLVASGGRDPTRTPTVGWGSGASSTGCVTWR